MDRLVTAVLVMSLVSVTAAWWALVVQGAAWLVAD
jgi:hypothetical protein